MQRKRFVWIAVLVTALVAATVARRGDRGSEEQEGGHAEPRGVLDAAAGARPS